jgi:hypothetical protein
LVKDRRKNKPHVEFVAGVGGLSLGRFCGVLLLALLCVMCNEVLFFWLGVVFGACCFRSL